MYSTILQRANTLLLMLLVIMVGIVIAFQASRAYGGPLDPPGSPGSTDGVREPGTPIWSIPLTISSPGRYYLTRDLTGVAAASAITIAANDVTLDLHGFTLRGVAGSVDGVFISGAHTAIVIENGIVRDWYNGIDATSGAYVRISGVTVQSNGIAAGNGYGVILTNDSTIAKCNVSGNHGDGIYALASTVRECTAAENGGAGVIAAGNSDIDHNVVRNNAAASSHNGLLVTGHANVIRDNSVCDGIRVGDGGITPTDSNVVRDNSFHAFSIAGALSTFFPALASGDSLASLAPDGNNIIFSVGGHC